MRCLRPGIGDATDEILFSTPSVFDPNGGTVYSPVTLMPVNSPATPAAATGDWFSRDVLPVVTTLVNAGAGVVKAFAPTTISPYGAPLPAGVSPLVYNSMTAAQQQAYLASMQTTNPFSAQLKAMLPMILLSGAGLIAFKMLKSNR